jgi:DNA-binding winged helix-turn-helix (wHTH) protein
VLAILVRHAGEVVSADRLIEALWGDEPPARAAMSCTSDRANGC